jgi:hypothetical protein
VNLGGKTLTALGSPPTGRRPRWSFQASADGGQTWGELLDQTATAVTVPSIPGGAYAEIAVDPAKWRAVRAVKVHSGTAASPVNQLNAVTVNLLTRFVQ